MNSPEANPLRQIWHFVVHLRWHYQLFILSGGYLMGGLFQESMQWPSFLVQYFNVHLLLYGGATAYNSYWDRDKGPIGGLRRPPRMKRWMWPASLLLQGAGLVIALGAGSAFAAIYALSMLFFWLYSTPRARWKGKPVRSLVAIGISTGTNSFLLGYLAAGSGNLSLNWQAVVAAVGVGLVILSLYPASQFYQVEEDKGRGDQTFAIRFGVRGVLLFFRCAFAAGILLLALALAQDYPAVGGLFLLAGGGIGFWIWSMLGGISGLPEEYDRVMKIKYGSSLGFVVVLIAGIIWKHL